MTVYTSSVMASCCSLVLAYGKEDSFGEKMKRTENEITTDANFGFLFLFSPTQKTT